MTRCVCCIVVALLFLFLTVPVMGKNYLLHSPKLWTPEEKEQYEKENPPAIKKKEQIKKDQVLVKDGVSYREVTVQKGDTVYGISRRYSKEGASYPYTLRFNNIKNPDEIVIGNIIKVPLNIEKKAKKLNQTKQVKPSAAAVSKQPVTARAARKPVPAKVLTHSSKTPTRQKAIQPQEAKITKPPAEVPQVSAEAAISPPPQTFSNNSTSGQKLFEQAIKSYRNGDCQNAIQLFSRFLAGHTTSVLAADASLLIADCYLKLSGK